MQGKKWIWRKVKILMKSYQCHKILIAAVLIVVLFNKRDASFALKVWLLTSS